MSSTPPPPPFGNNPPPPPFGNTPPTPPGAIPGWSQPPMAPQGYDLGQTGKPPKPDVKVGAILTLVGGILLVIGAVLPWLTGGGDSANGFDDYFYVDSNGDFVRAEAPGTTWVFFGIVLFGLGLTLVLAKRVLPVAIIAIVAAGIALFMVLGSFAIISDVKDGLNEGVDASYGIGLFVGVLGMAAALAGSIAATAKRRRAR